MPRQKTKGGETKREQTVAEDAASYLAQKYGIRDGEVKPRKDSAQSGKKKEPPKR